MSASTITAHDITSAAAALVAEGQSPTVRAVRARLGTGSMTTSPDAYAARVAPLLIASELEEHSGAMFNNKAEAILPSPKLGVREVQDFMVASDALARKAGVTFSA